MHAVFRCKKDSGSTWEIMTHVKSVFFTADIFAVHLGKGYGLILLPCEYVIVYLKHPNIRIIEEAVACCYSACLYIFFLLKKAPIY